MDSKQTWCIPRYALNLRTKAGVSYINPPRPRETSTDTVKFPASDQILNVGEFWVLIKMAEDFSSERALFGGAIVSTFPIRFQVCLVQL